jgi:hypothetical protein
MHSVQYIWVLKTYLRHVSLQVSTIFREQNVPDLKLICSRPIILVSLIYYTCSETCRSYVFNILLYIYVCVCIYIYIYIYIHIYIHTFNTAHLVGAINWVHWSECALKIKPKTSINEAGMLPVSFFYDIWFVLQFVTKLILILAGKLYSRNIGGSSTFAYLTDHWL